MNRESRLRSRRVLDDRFRAMPAATTFRVPKHGWIRSIREALGMTASDLGERLGVAPQTVLSLEKSEIAGRARMDSLKRAAEAMDCSLVYAFLPNSSLEDFAQAQAEFIITETLKRVSHSMKLEGQETAFSDTDYVHLLDELKGSSRIWHSMPPKS